MSRAQQGQTFDTAQANEKTYNTDAQTSFDTAQKDIGTYGEAVGKFDAANPYVNGGAVETATDQAAADTAAGQAQQAGQTLQGQAVRTGQNAGGSIAATEEMQQQNERNLVGQEANATLNRAAAGTGYGEAVLGAKSTEEQMQDTLAKQQQEAAQGNLGTQEEAAKTPSFMDELGQGLITAGSNVAGALACVAARSMVLMADDSMSPIELIRVGETVKGIDNQPQKVVEIRIAQAPILTLIFENGLIGHVSPSHALMLPFGGYTAAARSHGRVIQTERGPSMVVIVSHDDDGDVYNLITDGSHTYQADGIWAIGDDEQAVEYGN